MQSYFEYLAVQRETTERKRDKQWIDRASISWIATHIQILVRQAERGVCHGVRNGFEQLWFMENIPNSRVVGTDLAEWSDRNPYQMKWDMHDMHPDWLEAFDFVYTNSWDHAYDLPRAVGSWVRSVAPGGCIVLTHSQDHIKPTFTDPTGMELDELVATVQDTIQNTCNDKWELYIPKEAPNVVPPGFPATQPKPVDHIFFIRSS